ncbi:hypothetical protein [Desertimonas flava]|nr:hypothetical protein [Desertimonas flava]
MTATSAGTVSAASAQRDLQRRLVVEALGTGLPLIRFLHPPTT